MRGLAVLILAALFALAGYATYALGDQPAVPRCATPAGMSAALAALAASFGEQPIAAGEIVEATSGGVLSIHVHPTTRAWTAVVSSFDGRACVIAGGERWAAIPEREAARPR